MLYFRQILAAASNRYSYLIADLRQREALIIDPVAHQNLLYVSLLKEIQVRLRAVLLTHRHQVVADDESLLDVPGIKFYAGVDQEAPAAVVRVSEDRQIILGGETITARPTPGHTAGALCYFWRDRVFTGDTLLIGEARPDCDDEDPAALFDSVARCLLPPPDETLIYPGRRVAGRMVSCIGEQRACNPLLGAMSRDEFIAACLRQRASATLFH